MYASFGALISETYCVLEMSKLLRSDRSSPVEIIWRLDAPFLPLWWLDDGEDLYLYEVTEKGDVDRAGVKEYASTSVVEAANKAAVAQRDATVDLEKNILFLFLMFYMIEWNGIYRKPVLTVSVVVVVVVVDVQVSEMRKYGSCKSRDFLFLFFFVACLFAC